MMRPRGRAPGCGLARSFPRQALSGELRGPPATPAETVIDGADWISLDSLLSVKAEKQLPAERRERRYGNAHFFGGG